MKDKLNLTSALFRWGLDHSRLGVIVLQRIFVHICIRGESKNEEFGECRVDGSMELVERIREGLTRGIQGSIYCSHQYLHVAYKMYILPARVHSSVMGRTQYWGIWRRNDDQSHVATDILNEFGSGGKLWLLKSIKTCFKIELLGRMGRD